MTKHNNELASKIERVNVWLGYARDIRENEPTEFWRGVVDGLETALVIMHATDDDDQRRWEEEMRKNRPPDFTLPAWRTAMQDIVTTVPIS